MFLRYCGLVFVAVVIVVFISLLYVYMWGEGLFQLLLLCSSNYLKIFFKKPKFLLFAKV